MLFWKRFPLWFTVLLLSSISLYAAALLMQPPARQAEQNARSRNHRQALPIVVGASVGTGVAALAAIVLLGQQFRLETFNTSRSKLRLTKPPAPIAPAVAAHLANSSTAYLGTFFDLVRRGVLQIENDPHKPGGPTVAVVGLSEESTIAAHERAFVQAILSTARNNRLALDQVASLAGSPAYHQALDEEIAAVGWSDQQRALHRARFVALALAGLVVGSGLFSISIYLSQAMPPQTWLSFQAGMILSGAGSALCVVGLIGLMLGKAISPLSAEGVRQLAAWNSFAAYLRDITRGREAVIFHDSFERYLPYAAAFGFASEWTNYFNQLEKIAISAWYRAMQAGEAQDDFLDVKADSLDTKDQ